MQSIYATFEEARRIGWGAPRARSAGPTPLALARALRAGKCLDDRQFDSFLPRRWQAVSGRYWTPLLVVARATAWLDELGVRTVVDVGSGAGKFCVAGALLGNAQFIGIEQRAELIGTARVLARLYGVEQRVSFVHDERELPRQCLGRDPTPRSKSGKLPTSARTDTPLGKADSAPTRNRDRSHEL